MMRRSLRRADGRKPAGATAWCQSCKKIVSVTSEDLLRLRQNITVIMLMLQQLKNTIK